MLLPAREVGIESAWDAASLGPELEYRHVALDSSIERAATAVRDHTDVRCQLGSAEAGGRCYSCARQRFAGQRRDRPGRAPTLARFAARCCGIPGGIPRGAWHFLHRDRAGWHAADF